MRLLGCDQRRPRLVGRAGCKAERWSRPAATSAAPLRRCPPHPSSAPGRPRRSLGRSLCRPRRLRRSCALPASAGCCAGRAGRTGRRDRGAGDARRRGACRACGGASACGACGTCQCAAGRGRSGRGRFAPATAGAGHRVPGDAASARDCSPCPRGSATSRRASAARTPTSSSRQRTGSSPPLARQKKKCCCTDQGGRHAVEADSHLRSDLRSWPRTGRVPRYLTSPRWMALLDSGGP